MKAEPCAVVDAIFVGRDETATLKPAGKESAVFLHFLLLPAADLEKAMTGAPAVVTELYRTMAPIPSLKSGPYEFTLTALRSRRECHPIRRIIAPAAHSTTSYQEQGQ